MEGKPAAETQRHDQELDKYAERERKREAEGGVVEVPKPVHGDPSAQNPPAPGDSVINVRTGSEAAVESGMGPVLPAGGPGVAAYTRVRNRDMRDRDEKEFKKRGFRADGRALVGTPVSLNFEGVMMVERGEHKQLAVGSYTGQIPPEGLTIRPLTEKEKQEHLPSALPRKPSDGSTTSRS